jgi:hypothetical protein
MGATVNDTTANIKENKDNSVDLYREPIKKALYSAIGDAIDDETQRATQEMMQVREKAIQELIEEEKNVIKKIIEDEKKSIWTKTLEETQSADFNAESIKEKLTETLKIEQTVDNEVAKEPESPPENHNNNHNENHVENALDKKVELVILPPRDQDEIAAINTFLINMPEAVTVELITLVDKSVFRVKLRESVDFIEKLGSIPQVLNAEEVVENGVKKINITLLAKSKREKNQNEINEKVKKIFYKKK